jgi:hypothetical protein
LAPAAAPVPAHAVDAAPDPLGAAAVEPLGVAAELQALNMSTAAAINGSSLKREAAMAVSSSTDVRGLGRSDISALRSANGRRAVRFPAGAVVRRIARARSLGGPIRVAGA